ncbi:hypothetical protein M5689_003248 [Euphorbia peplus]|nr:hypothetical protein M5689_003248 [Euphorbia peplus]
MKVKVKTNIWQLNAITKLNIPGINQREIVLATLAISGVEQWRVDGGGRKVAGGGGRSVAGGGERWWRRWTTEDRWQEVCV